MATHVDRKLSGRLTAVEQSSTYLASKLLSSNASFSDVPPTMLIRTRDTTAIFDTEPGSATDHTATHKVPIQALGSKKNGEQQVDANCK